MFGRFVSALGGNAPALSRMTRDQLVAEFALRFPNDSAEGKNVKKLRDMLRAARERGFARFAFMALFAVAAVLMLGGCEGILPGVGPNAAGAERTQAPNVAVNVSPALVVRSEAVEAWSEAGGTNSRGDSARNAQGDGTVSPSADFASEGGDPFPAPPISLLDAERKAPFWSISTGEWGHRYGDRAKQTLPAVALRHRSLMLPSATTMGERRLI